MHTIFFVLSMLVVVILANVVFRHYGKIPLPIYRAFYNQVSQILLAN